jgi:hypothetical protein
LNELGLTDVSVAPPIAQMKNQALEVDKELCFLYACILSFAWSS